MLLKSIKLVNFRQFKGEQKVEFSTHQTKNVTLIFGDNGSGKTTFAQAFMWCFNNETEFADPILLNSDISSELMVGENIEVIVSVELKHNNSDQIITRKIQYKKTNSPDPVVDSSNFMIQYKLNGQQEFLSALQSEKRIKEILPKELAKYFFFDGERINALSKRIVNGDRSPEFAEAVKNLLGLKAFSEAIRLLRSPGQNNVISVYNRAYNDTAGGQVSGLTAQIESDQYSIQKIEENIQIFEQEILDAEERITTLVNEINKYTDGEQVQQDRKDHSIQIQNLQREKGRKIKNFLTVFNISNVNYFLRKMINNATSYLDDTEVVDNLIPALGAPAIRHILENDRCICGTPIARGSIEEQTLQKLIDYIPPKSIGTLILDYSEKAKNRDANNLLYANSINTYRDIRDLEEKIASHEHAISEIDDLLTSMPDVTKFQVELKQKREFVNQRHRDIANYREQIGTHKILISQNEGKRDNLIILNANNIKIDRYKKYAEAAYQQLHDIYIRKEVETRDSLEKEINRIFNQIFSGDIQLFVNDNYSIEVQITDGTGTQRRLGLSTAQSISVIFSFIAGVIELMRKNQSSISDNTFNLSEPYPMVMDAPLSAFDQKRIKAVCEILPKTAEQVIFFIKDTDGNIAEENLRQAIGKRYEFKKHHMTHTEIQGV